LATAEGDRFREENRKSEAYIDIFRAAIVCGTTAESLCSTTSR
jgi:hypothetical protein